ncbi:MAG: single-stranded-DNA-specific exonuclease RecJ [Zoogloeaceae bacterium]|jgi:single-stranded-DNA-specific exonuclease|nr:single-stranded-DNA-specific exonuclease RecJ [Zoogloeaceae bacterium]
MSRLLIRSFPASRRYRLEQAGVPPLLARLYAARGVADISEVDYRLQCLAPPEALLHAEEAARLIADALAANARLLIVADYDCDGATACAVGIRGLEGLIRARPGCGASVCYLVPDRFTLGYGLSPAIVDLAAREKPDLIITVDNGIASLEGVARARALGIATLITDHHLPGDSLPDADCIVNPNQPGCAFPSKHLAGVGVMFYVLIALRAELRRRGWFCARAEPSLASLLDLVALGTVADVVPLDYNNRILISAGLARMRSGRSSPGISALLAAAGRRPETASVFDFGFLLGPRLNAAGRLENMSIGIECLLTDDPDRALMLARQLDRLNRERRDIEAGMREQAETLLDKIDMADTPPGVALFAENWHPGVVGILASRVKEKLHRPVFAFARGENGEIKGSGRSIPGLNLRDALDSLSKRVPGLLLRFGGHAAAAGVTMREADFPRFSALFSEIAAELIAPEDLTRRLNTDGSLDLSSCNLAAAKVLGAQIWGQGFPPPLFYDAFEVRGERLLKEKHLRLTLAREGRPFNAVWFNRAVSPPPRASFAYALEVNAFRGVESAELRIEECADAEGGALP